MTRSDGTAGVPGTAELVFDAAAGTVSARISPMQWEGASWELAAADSYYLADDDLGGSNISNDPANPNRLQGAADPSVLCDCDYLSWGSWNASIDANGTTYGPDAGYWVVGQLSTSADLPLSGLATYSGQAIGTVNDGGAVLTGVTGSFTASVDFGTGLGSLQIDGFAGRSFGDSNLDINSGSMLAWGFSGQLSDTAGLSGQYNAAFATDGVDPAAAMIGTFSAEDGAWSASGVFGGTRP